MTRVLENPPTWKALHTAKWARTMAKWTITHSSKGGVKWQVVQFNGKGGQESAGIVDMLAIRKNHKPSGAQMKRGDPFEMILVQVKGGSAPAPSEGDIARMLAVKNHHKADRIVQIEWKKGSVLRCIDLETGSEHPASEIFGNVPSTAKIAAQLQVQKTHERTEPG
jgi:hypothetical protein